MSELGKEMACEPNILSVNEFDDGSRCEKRQREKSSRDSSGASIGDDGFTVVTRRRPKCIALRKSCGSDLNDDVEMSNKTQESEKIEVSITSKEILPKQMALAKLLRAENIESILNVKYKSPYRVLIEFSDTENANKLINNRKFAEFDYRCQSTQGMHIVFGVIRNIDMDVQEEDMGDIFESKLEILSIKRLKRLNANGDWVTSESVRVCFKSSTLPSYILIYGCRFKVEAFTFPVTQCTACWKYGHSKKFCPRKRLLCPKCGNKHPNCDTTVYYCINCKGNHMAFDKTCPIFNKEKKIRKIMCEENCKYRKALLIYCNKNKLNYRLKHNMNKVIDEIENRNILYNERNVKRTYRDVLVTEGEIQNGNNETSSNSEKEEEDIEIVKPRTQKVKRRKKKSNKAEGTTSDTEFVTENMEREERETEQEKEHGKRRKRFDFIRLFMKIKEVYFTQTSFDNKIIQILKVIAEEVKVLVVELLKDSDILKNIFSIFYNG